MSFFALFAIGDAYALLQPPLAFFPAGPTSGPLADPVLACLAIQVREKGSNNQSLVPCWWLLPRPPRGLDRA